MPLQLPLARHLSALSVVFAWVAKPSPGMKSMFVDRFLDTNILLCGYDLDAGPKREVATSLIADGWRHLGRTAVSVQVLQEFYVNLVRLGQSHRQSRLIIEDLSKWPVIDNTLEGFGHGLALCGRFKLSLWDAMILAAAKASGARELLTEDLNHGQDYDGVLVLNPFLRA
jgi:predicted nucleic acid-binding protein